MTTEELENLFETHDDEFLKFEKVKNKTSKRSDLHAFTLLDKLCPGKSDMVAAAEHDEIFLDVELEDLAKVVTEEQIIELIRCGVRYNTEVGSLAMYV
jgi:hypothetical protein